MATNDAAYDGTSTETQAPTQTQAQTRSETRTVTLPAIGTIVGGKDDDPMIVIKHTDETAGEYTFPNGGEEVTISEVHGCPPDSPVVETYYLESLDRNVEGWREAYIEKDGEEFVEWIETFCSENGITDRVLKPYGYSKSAIHDLHELDELVEVEIPR